jgi:hypothetical protein
MQRHRGVDQVTWQEYGENLEQNLIDLEERLKQKRYWLKRKITR